MHHMVVHGTQTAKKKERKWKKYLPGIFQQTIRHYKLGKF